LRGGKNDGGDELDAMIEMEHEMVPKLKMRGESRGGENGTLAERRRRCSVIFLNCH